MLEDLLRLLLLAQRKRDLALGQFVIGKVRQPRPQLSASTRCCSGRIALRQQDVGFEFRGLQVEDAVRIALIESVQQRLGRCLVALVRARLGGQKIRIVRQLLAVLPRLAQVGSRIRITLVQQVGVPQRQVSRRGRIAGLLVRLSRHSRIGSRGAHGHQLLRHGPQLRGSHKRLLDARRPRHALRLGSRLSGLAGVRLPRSRSCCLPADLRRSRLFLHEFRMFSVDAAAGSPVPCPYTGLTKITPPKD